MKIFHFKLGSAIALAFGQMMVFSAQPSPVQAQSMPSSPGAAWRPYGQLNVLSYNVAGLPAGFNADQSPDKNTKLISPLLNNYDIVNVQENWGPYQEDLKSALKFPYVSTPAGSGFFESDGLNTLSKYPWIAPNPAAPNHILHVPYRDCSNIIECLAGKGFTVARTVLPDGSALDVYNTHTTAGDKSADMRARAANLRQMSDFMKTYSAGRAVLLMMDSNSRYTRGPDNLRYILDQNGLSDPWVDLILGGNAPAAGAPALVCSKILPDPSKCEVVDKIFYRGSDDLKLQALKYVLDNPLFYDSAGQPLSDHSPLSTLLGYRPGSADVLSEMDKYWTASGGSGKPTAAGAALLQRNLEIGAQIAGSRTPAQEAAAYYDNRRNQSYGVISGLGPLADLYRQGAGATTSITRIDGAASSTVVTDAGTGAGTSASALGKVVDLVDAAQASTSTATANAAFTFPGAAGSALNGKPLGDLVQASLKPVAQAADDGFPSSVTTKAYISALALGYAVPWKLSDLVFRASEIGNSQIVSGLNGPLGVIGGRIEGTYFATRNLSDPANADLRAGAVQQAAAYFAQACGGSVATCLGSIDPAADHTSQHAIDKQVYRARLSYGLPTVGDTTLPADVPNRAEILLESRFPYLSDQQRRDVLASTQIASGQAFSNGYARLNLMDAADGYGSFTGTVTVTMDAARGGLNAFDVWRNDISGPGGLTKAGTGQLVLTGQNSYAGGTNVREGVLTTWAGGLGTGVVTNDAVLELAQSVDGTLTNRLEGGGLLRKTGAGLLDLAGTGGFSGRAAIEGGGLQLDGNLPAMRIEAATGTTISGDGSARSLRLAGGATLSQGGASGTLTLLGDLVLAPGSSYVATLAAHAAAPLTQVGGTATIDGAALRVVQGDRLASLTGIPLIGGAVAGRFASVAGNWTFLTPQVSYGGAGATVSLVRNDLPFARFAATPNQSAVAGGIDGLDGRSRLWTWLAQGNGGDVSPVLATLGNELQATGRGIALIEGDLLRQSLQRRLTGPAAAGEGVWGQWIDDSGSSTAPAGLARASHATSGALFGVDGIPSADLPLRVGAVAGVTSSSLSAAGRGQVRSDNYHAGLYANAWSGPASVSLGAVYSRLDTKMHRSLNLPWVSSDSVVRPGADRSMVFGEVAYAIQAAPFSLQPYAGLNWVRLSSEAFIETAPLLRLSSAAAAQDRLFGALGLRIAADPIPVAGLALRPWIDAGWEHGIGRTALIQSISIDDGPSVSISGLPLDRNTAVFQGGLAIDLATNVVAGFRYAARWGTRQDSRTLSGNLAIRF